MKVLAILVGAFFAGIAFAIVFSLPTMWLWNWLMPSIFHLRTITVWEAMGLAVLGSCLFPHSSSSSP